MKSSRVIIIVGPTASGKSAHALRMAREQGGVVINADSMQLYNGLPLLTAQPTDAEKSEIPHRLYGVLGPEETANAATWREMALAEIDLAHDANLIPIITGGTGFYIKSLTEGLSSIPEIPEEVRVMADDLMDQIGVDEFYKMLQREDPLIAGKLDPKNRQRLVRAYEVLMGTGRSLSYWQSLPPILPPSSLEFHTILLMPDREVLYERCNMRFIKMIDAGCVDEVRNFDDLIMAGKIPFDSPLCHALGFRPLQSYVRGEMDLDTAIFLSQNETRHYAKRQVTWFKNQIKADEVLYSISR